MDVKGMTRTGCAAGFAVFAAGAGVSAQEWSAQVGGEAIIGGGYVDTAPGETEAMVVMDSEIFFDFVLVADNGLTFSAKAELENNGAAGNMDEYAASVSGGFGTIEIGAEDGAGDRLLLTPPGCNLSCSGDGDGFLFDYGEDAAGDAIDNAGGDTSDDLKITYFTPTLSGFRLGGSYAPTGEAGPTSSSILRDDGGLELGGRWDIDLTEVMGDEGAELAIGGSYFSVDDFEDDSYVFAAELDAYGFGVGGRYAFIDADAEQNFSVGIEYATGPWSGGVTWTQVVDSEARGDDDFGVSAEVNYALAPGVTLAGIVEFADYSFEDDVATPEDESEPDGGFAAGLLMELAF